MDFANTGAAQPIICDGYSANAGPGSGGGSAGGGGGSLSGGDGGGLSTGAMFGVLILLNELGLIDDLGDDLPVDLGAVTS